MSFTPEEITEILEAYFESIAHRQYIGSRYVPIFGRVGEASCDWDNTGDYEPLTIVLYQGNSYTSRQFVPAGADINNTDYWVLTGNFNAQVEQYRLRLVDVENAMPIADFDSTNTIKKYIDDGYAAINLEKAQVFDTVSDMKAADLVSGMICHTSGFYTVDDGGAAWYEIKDTGTANEMNIIACGTLKAHLIFENAKEVKAKQLGLISFDTLAEAKSADSDTKNFNQNIQDFIEAGKSVFFDAGFYPFADYLNMKAYTELYSNKATLVFPSSDGLCVDRAGEYTNRIHIHDINVTAYGIAFNFQKAANRNVYMCTFENMVVESETSNCFDGGTNKTPDNDTLFFQNTIRNVGVKAPNGYGFVMLTGTENIFDRIYDLPSILEIFHNTSGTITNFNGTFGGAKWLIHYDLNTSNAAYIVLKDCNIESFVDGAVYIENTAVYVARLIIENVTFYHTLQAEKKIIHPWRLTQLSTGNIEVVGYAQQFPSGKSWSDIYDAAVKESTFLSTNIPNTFVGGNISGVVKIQVGTYVYKVNPQTSELGSYMSSFGTLRLSHYEEVHSDLFVGARLQQQTEITSLTSSQYIVLNGEREAPDALKLNLPASSTVSRFITQERWCCRPVVMFNISDDPVTIKNGTWSGTNNIVLAGGADLVLAKDDFIVFDYVCVNNSVRYLKEVEHHIA